MGAKKIEEKQNSSNASNALLKAPGTRLLANATRTFYVD
jgi:hypothetical protein